MLTVRPKVTELTFQLYGRPLHPELFEVFTSREIHRGGYRAKVQITNAGHVVTWRHEGGRHEGGMTLTEVAAAAHQPLPKQRRLLFHRLRGERNDQGQCRTGIEYDVSFQLEKLDPTIFWDFQQQLAQDSGCRGLVHLFNSSGRVALGALSYVNIETRERSMLVQAFHTFPDDSAIVKIQSLFRLPEPSSAKFA